MFEGKAPTLTSRILLFSFKWLSAFLISFTMSTIVLGLMNLGVWSFVFVFVAFQAILWKLLNKANLIFVMIVDAVFVVVIIAFKLYVILGPNF
jgi:hypothetical protein